MGGRGEALVELVVVSARLTRLARNQACALAALLLACTSSCTSSSTPAPRTPGPPQRFAVQGVGVTAYASEPPEGPALLGPHALRVAKGLERAMAATGRTLAPDARLAQLARMLLETLAPDGEPAPYAARELWTRHLGLPEPTPHVLVLAGADPSTVEQHTEEDATRTLPKLRYTHYGAATADGPNGAQVVVVLSWRWASLSPLPRSVAKGVRLRVRGRLLDGLKDPQLVVTEPSGKSYRLPIQRGAAFDAEVVAANEGELRVELLAESEQGPAPVINVPVYVGVSPPTEVSVQTTSGGESIGLDAQAFERRLLELVQAERARVGVAPLSSEPRLVEIARAHGEDMRAHGFVGHTSATTGTAADRVARAGVRTGLVLENVGRGYTPEEVHQSLLDSPGHRANVVSPDATHLGVGAVIEEEGGRAAYLATELFVRLGSTIDVATAPAELLEKLNAARAQHKLRALELEPALSQLAAQGAAELFASAAATQKTIVEHVSRQASSRARGYKRLATVMILVSSLDEAAALDALLDPAARGVGLGVAQGSRTDAIENAIAVVAVIAY
jgi:uncharacterized protein YkwD